jgi:hypothetical protein
MCGVQHADGKNSGRPDLAAGNDNTHRQRQLKVSQHGLIVAWVAYSQQQLKPAPTLQEAIDSNSAIRRRC